MKISVGALRRLLQESLSGKDEAAPSQNLGQLVDAMAAQFSAKMRAQYPHAADAIAREAADLKTQVTATIKAAAAKVKMAAQG